MASLTVDSELREMELYKSIVLFQELLPPKMRIKSKHLNSLHVCMYIYTHTHVLVYTFCVYVCIF